jgi:xeroderma pigmentosum group C-complementing protein
MELEDFRRAAASCKGSRDIGAQLFCVLLRSAGVETRLVCSLQVLSFSSNTGKTTSPQKPLSNVIYAESVEDVRKHQSDAVLKRESTESNGAHQKGGPSSLVSKRAKRLGLPAFGVDQFQEPINTRPQGMSSNRCCSV